MIKHFCSFQMPRNWTRKTSKASWTVDNLQAAAVRIRQGVSMRKVAEETGIPFSTLQRRIKKDEFKPPKLGRHAVFNEEQENILTERVLQLSNMFHGLTTNQLRKTSFLPQDIYNIDETEATASTSSRNVIGPQPFTSDDITNYKTNDSINQENNKSDSEPLAGVLSQLTPMPCIGKGKSKGKRTQQSEILTATPLKTVFKEKAKKRKKKEKHTGGRAIKRKKEVKKNLFKSSSSEESADEQVPYESGDSDLENIELPLNIQKNTQIERDQSVCTICLEEGKPREIWYRCHLCAGWAHEACTECDDPSRYRCDFCIN
ncbi:unnamed protein product [Parnassius apollo]|uniref:(apollo) hypothetical protein n=1 Tax=Parnassius apollo TaxID=110799 RepID=A0A8S3Y2K0_PARAO|nr:unnamed protein product [Parnassius apollo]